MSGIISRLKKVMKKYTRIGLVIILILTFASLVIFALSFIYSSYHDGKWLTTAGLLTTLAGVVQLEVSGFFDKIMKHYKNLKKYPGGPPSKITREIIWNPDTPIRTRIRSIIFFSVKTGFWLIVCGTVMQVIAVWV